MYQAVDQQKTGCVFNIQKFSLHDGPGIRDLVFLKGCPLRCRWCSNPESQQKDPQLLFKVDHCLGIAACGLCREICPVQAIQKGKDDNIRIDWNTCNHCGQCAEVCPADALEIAGKQMTADEIIEIIEKDGGFHFRSGGGITVSGGEPIMQADFTAHLLKTCKKHLMTTALETCGHGKWESLEKIVPFTDVIHYDIKSADSIKHKAFTGVSNMLIMENLHRLSARFPEKSIIVRTPVIPKFNDSEKDITDIIDSIKKIKSITDYQLLPFHRFGFSKYDYLGKSCSYADVKPLSDDAMDRLKSIAHRRNRV